MFQAMDGFDPQVVAVRAVGKVSGDDYASVLAPAVALATEGGRKARLLIVLGSDFEGYEPSGLAGDAGLGFGHLGSFERMAIVTDVPWMREAIRLFAGLIPGDVRLFPNAEEDVAEAWIRRVTVHGTVDPSFEAVRAVFEDVVAGQSGAGAGLAVWHDGGWVVDLWGGFVDAARSRPWEADTVVMTYSVCKPFAAMCALVLADRGLIDLDAPLTRYWPEMVAPTTMRQVLAHQSGHVVLDAPAPEEAFYDWDRLCRLLAEQPPAWPPGTAHGEAALFYGHLIGEVVRRVDGRTLGTFLREEICEPEGLDFHIGLSDGELARVADLTGYGDAFRATQDGWTDLLRRGLANPPGAIDPAVVNGERWRRAEIPAVNGHGTAKGVAGLYVALHEGRILSPAMLATATSVAASGRDLVMGDERAWGLGVVLDPDGFGMGGLGGSLGWWSEVGRYALGFVTGEIAGYDRSERLENAVRDVIGLPPIG